MVGQYINKGMIDQMSSQTIINMRNAMVAMEYLIQWMAMNPVVNGEDMLVTNTEPRSERTSPAWTPSSPTMRPLSTRAGVSPAFSNHEGRSPT